MKRKLIFALKLATSIGVLLYVLRHIPLEDIAAAMQRANLGFVTVSFLVALVAFFFGAQQFKVFTDSYQLNLSLHRILHVNFATQFYNLFLPGFLAGGVIRWYRFTQGNQKGIEVFSSIVLNRFINMSLLVWVGLTGWIVAQEPFRFQAGSWLLVLSSVVFALLLLALHAPRCMRYVENALGSKHMRSGGVHEKILKLLRSAKAYQQLDVETHARIVLYGLLWQLLSATGAYLCCLALSLKLSFWSILWIRALTTFSILLPISIAGIGVREGVCVYLFSLMNLTPALALVFSMLLFFQHIFLGVIGAALEFKTLLREKYK